MKGRRVGGRGVGSLGVGREAVRPGFIFLICLFLEGLRDGLETPQVRNLRDSRAVLVPPCFWQGVEGVAVRERGGGQWRRPPLDGETRLEIRVATTPA